jgi:hypothetical protein
MQRQNFGIFLKKIFMDDKFCCGRLRWIKGERGRDEVREEENQGDKK